MQSVLAAVVAALTLAYYAPSAHAMLCGRAGGEMHWPSRLAMYAAYGLFFAALASGLPAFGPPGPLNYLGAIPAIAGVWLHYLSVRGLGGSYSAGIAFSKKPRLVTTGVYSIARHPLYSAAALFFLGMAILLLSPVLAAAYALVLAYLAYRVSVEESALRKKFGKAYAQYSGRVPATVFGWALRR